jgi:hypothetical protein
MMPVVGHGRDDAVDVLVVQQVLITARHQDGLAHNLLGQFLPAGVKLARRDALDAGQGNGVSQQSRAAHAHSNNAKVHGVTGGSRPGRRGIRC